MGEIFHGSNKGVYVCCDQLHEYNIPCGNDGDNMFVLYFTLLSKSHNFTKWTIDIGVTANAKVLLGVGNL
jgi:hypothetical protein